MEMTSGKVLISLQELLTKLDTESVKFWSFRDITLTYPSPFGISVLDFESLSRNLSIGFLVSAEDFRVFLKSDFQIIDGCINGYTERIDIEPIITIECVDSTQWEIST